MSTLSARVCDVGSALSRLAACVRAVQVNNVAIVLLGCAEGEEECRNVAAECLGLLGLVSPALVLPQLHARLQVRRQPFEHTFALLLTAVRW